MSGAPGGLLTALEGGHHDKFIERARAGDIDIVLFGTTETEMWNWPDRGRSVWDRHRDKLTLAIGAGSGAAIGGLIGGKRGAVIGAVSGLGASAVYTYKLRNRRYRY